MNNDEKGEALHDAARLCGFDGHVKVIAYKNECFTRAEQIAETRTPRPFPVKNSYLYCDTLDACCSFAGCVRYGTGDYERMGKTVEHIQAMLLAMRMTANLLEIRKRNGDVR